MRLVYRLLDGIGWCFLKCLKGFLWCFGKVLITGYWCCTPLLTLYWKKSVRKDPFIRRMDKLQKRMDKIDENDPDKTKIIKELMSAMDESFEISKAELDLRKFKYMRPREYIVKMAAPPYGAPKRVWKYVDDYYTKLWGFNSNVCRCCEKRKPIKEFKVKRYDFHRKGLIQHSSNCKECLKGLKAYRKTLTFFEKIGLTLDRVGKPLNKEDKKIRKHNRWLSSLSQEALDAI